MNAWEGLMLVAGGLFAGGATTFSWSRVPIWRTMSLAEFAADFSATISRTDKVQPALLVTAIVATVAHALSTDGAARGVASAGAAGFAVTLLASVTVLVPLQRRIIAAAPTERTDVYDMRDRWFRGHLGRSVLSTTSFVAVAVAATL